MIYSIHVTLSLLLLQLLLHSINVIKYATLLMCINHPYIRQDKVCKNKIAETQSLPRSHKECKDIKTGIHMCSTTTLSVSADMKECDVEDNNDDANTAEKSAKYGHLFTTHGLSVKYSTSSLDVDMHRDEKRSVRK